MLIDTHAHLTDARFDTDRAETIKRAKDAGISNIIEIACDPQKWDKALKLSKDNPGIYCALGLHPQDAKLYTPELFAQLEQLVKDPTVVALGETGFDYHYENSPRNTQNEVFIRHIEISVKTGKPLVIHCREAYPDLIGILKNYNCRGTIHCFSGSVAEALELVTLGYYLGIDGPLTYPKSEILREVVKQIPLDRLVIETDSPYLPPQSFRGKRNEPYYIEHIAKEIARIKNIGLDAVGSATTANAVALFNLKPCR
jgi:TatD DNase family protein